MNQYFVQLETASESTENTTTVNAARSYLQYLWKWIDTPNYQKQHALILIINGTKIQNYWQKRENTLYTTDVLITHIHTFTHNIRRSNITWEWPSLVL